MEPSSIDKIVNILAAQSSADMSSVIADTELQALGIDSFDFIEAVFLIEDEFKIQIAVNYNDVGARLKTVGDIASAVDDLLAAKSKGAGSGTTPGANPVGNPVAA